MATTTAMPTKSTEIPPRGCDGATDLVLHAGIPLTQLGSRFRVGRRVVGIGGPSNPEVPTGTGRSAMTRDDPSRGRTGGQLLRLVIVNAPKLRTTAFRLAIVRDTSSTHVPDASSHLRAWARGLYLLAPMGRLKFRSV